MYFFLSIISLVVSTCLASEPVTVVKGLNGSCPIVKFAVEAINEHYKKQGDSATRTFLNISSASRTGQIGGEFFLKLAVSTPKKVELCQVDIMAPPASRDPNFKPFALTRGPICSEGTGFPVVVNINNTEVQKALTFAESKLNNDSDCPVLWKVVSVGQVTSQVVSGTLFQFTDVVWSPTNCPKNTTHSLIGCVPTKDIT
ncbi:uncharacterized protein LOC131953409, partial [Physella acuta]|uniref:uncharacterized protein LOC131953409 n=1 Tax=Physella acuta TaxID=109671 RepID=UPI0027DE10BD